MIKIIDDILILDEANNDVTVPSIREIDKIEILSTKHAQTNKYETRSNKNRLMM